MDRSFRLSVSLVGAGVVSFAHGPIARADAAGDAVLAQMDAAANKAKTLVFDYEIVNKEAADKAERTMAMNVKRKGEKRLTEFSSPADMKGTKVLVLSPTQ